MELKFYQCEKCGKVMVYTEELHLEGWKEIKAGEKEAAVEKHVPMVENKGDSVAVKVGSVSHPMTKEHLIEWVLLEKANGYEIKYMNADSAPEVCFALADQDEVKAVYAYCNLHGLWKA